MATIEQELAAALSNLLGQCEQMRGMFSDEDGNIQNAIDDGYTALNRYHRPGGDEEDDDGGS
jgi:hypothetical protein